MGDAARVADVSPETISAAMAIVGARVVHAVEKAMLRADDTPVIVVGGGGPLLAVVPGLEDLVIPENAGVANAVGAAFAEAGGEVDRVFNLAGRSRVEVLDQAKAEAIAKAVEAGADPDTVRIVDAEDVPLTHLGGGSAVHVRVKAAGPFARSAAMTSAAMTSEGN